MGAAVTFSFADPGEDFFDAKGTQKHTPGKAGYEHKEYFFFLHLMLCYRCMPLVQEGGVGVWGAEQEDATKEERAANPDGAAGGA